jgi:hypothetical protein
LGKNSRVKEGKEPFWKVITDSYKLYEKEMNKLWQKKYNVYVYQKLPKPPDSQEKLII